MALGGRIYGKPTDETDACRMLAELSGHGHQVITGVCVFTPNEVISLADVTEVHFKQLDEETIEEYVACGEPLDKAGAYGIQGRGGALIDRIEGDFDNVVGLPVHRLEPLLRDLLTR